MLSDTGSETSGGGAAALLLAGFGRVASAGHVRSPRGVLAVALRASRAVQGRCKGWVETRFAGEAGAVAGDCSGLKAGSPSGSAKDFAPR